jgi:hypothetical protein
MGGISKSGKTTHDAAVIAAEGTRQAALAAAAQSPAGQAAINAAEIVCARAMLASADANNGGLGKEPYITLLKSLGTGGS